MKHHLLGAKHTHTRTHIQVSSLEFLDKLIAHLMLNGVAFKEGRCFCPRYTSLLSRNVQLLRVSSALAGDPRLSYRVNTSYLARTFPTKRVSRVINFTGSLIGRSCILARPNPLPTTNEIKVTRRQLIVILPLCIFHSLHDDHENVEKLEDIRRSCSMVPSMKLWRENLNPILMVLMTVRWQ